VPPGGDYAASALFAKTAMETGWCGVNPRLGAPYAFECYDFPMADGVSFSFFALFGRFSNDVTLGINLYYLLGYILIGLTSLFAFRQFGFSSPPSIAASLLFAFLPYHYLRSEYHLFLSAYFLVPLMIAVILWIYRGEAFVRPSARNRLRFSLTRKGTASLIICLSMGSGGVYYAAFALMFLLAVALMLLLRTGKFASLIIPAVAAGLIASSVLITLAPNLWFFHEYGDDLEVAHRLPSEVDTYGLKLTNLLLPITTHRVSALANLSLKYSMQGSPSGEGAEAIGLAGGFGFLVLIVCLFSETPAESRSNLYLLSRLNITAVLAGTIGGFGALFNFLVFPEIRVYARICVYIAFFCLAALLSLLRWAEPRVGGTRNKRLLFNFAAALLLLAGIWDLTPDLRMYPAAEHVSSFQSDQNFVRNIESAMAPGAMIYQLPYMPYPEHGPLLKMSDYDPVRGYLYSKSLRWSYGTTKGRPAAEWQQREANLPPKDLLPSLKLAGFSGVWIDSYGYPDGARAIIGQLRELLQINPLVSADKRFSFFPIANYQPAELIGLSGEEQKRRRDASLMLPVKTGFPGCSILEAHPDINWRWCKQDGEIQILNPNPRTAFYTLRMTLRTGEAQTSTFHFSGDLGSGDIQANSSGTEVVRNLKLSPGLHRFRIDSDASRVLAPNDPRDMHFQIVNLQLTRQ
jgi:phosphoglycerol transferase